MNNWKQNRSSIWEGSKQEITLNKSCRCLEKEKLLIALYQDRLTDHWCRTHLIVGRGSTFVLRSSEYHIKRRWQPWFGSGTTEIWSLKAFVFVPLFIPALRVMSSWSSFWRLNFPFRPWVTEWSVILIQCWDSFDFLSRAACSVSFASSAVTNLDSVNSSPCRLKVPQRYCLRYPLLYWHSELDDCDYYQL